MDSLGLTGANATFIAVVFALVLYNGSVICEIVRNGVGSLPSGQREAGLSIGLNSAQVRRSILVPQALTSMLPALVSQIVVITKDSALGYIITYPELLSKTRQFGSANANTLAVPRHARSTAAEVRTCVPQPLCAGVSTARVTVGTVRGTKDPPQPWPRGFFASCRRLSCSPDWTRTSNTHTRGHWP